MRLDGRRRSGNIEDRRGLSGKTIGIGGGIGGLIIVALLTLFSGGDLTDVISNVSNQKAEAVQTEKYVETEEDKKLADFCSIILAGTEDVWTKKFQEEGLGEYVAPKMVLFHGLVKSGCGNATSQLGPFYCAADRTVYIDLDFFKNMQSDIGGSGDFAFAYVVAHEVGHHVQNLLGILGKAHEKMAQVSETEANRISVRLELQADYLAGVWGCADNQMFNSLEDGDVEEAVDVAAKIGDDFLQKKALGYEMPDNFNHGRSAQRVKWLKKGLTNCTFEGGDTFSIPYSEL